MIPPMIFVVSRWFNENRIQPITYTDSAEIALGLSVAMHDTIVVHQVPAFPSVVNWAIAKPLSQKDLRAIVDSLAPRKGTET